MLRSKKDREKDFRTKQTAGKTVGPGGREKWEREKEIRMQTIDCGWYIYRYYCRGIGTVSDWVFVTGGWNCRRVRKRERNPIPGVLEPGNRLLLLSGDEQFFPTVVVTVAGTVGSGSLGRTVSDRVIATGGWNCRVSDRVIATGGWNRRLGEPGSTTEGCCTIGAGC